MHGEIDICRVQRVSEILLSLFVGVSASISQEITQLISGLWEVDWKSVILTGKVIACWEFQMTRNYYLIKISRAPFDIGALDRPCHHRLFHNSRFFLFIYPTSAELIPEIIHLYTKSLILQDMYSRVALLSLSATTMQTRHMQILIWIMSR